MTKKDENQPSSNRSSAVRRERNRRADASINKRTHRQDWAIFNFKGDAFVGGRVQTSRGTSGGGGGFINHRHSCRLRRPLVTKGQRGLYMTETLLQADAVLHVTHLDVAPSH